MIRNKAEYVPVFLHGGTNVAAQSGTELYKTARQEIDEGIKFIRLEHIFKERNTLLFEN